MHKNQKIYKKYHLPGITNVQFISTVDKDYFIELNPRIGGTTIASILSSFNYTEQLIKNVLFNVYSQALSRFPAHLQQLDMESNGKSVNRFGEPVNYKTGPVIFGEPGTNGQHSFYQLLHQGTDIIPLQFVGFLDSQMENDVVIEGSTSQKKLAANVTAQIMAFACGKDDDDQNKYFEGNRPSSLIIGKKLDPKALGALLAHFENKVMFQGFTWNLNSFDQEGVQLGKKLAKKVLAHETDGALKAYADLFEI